MSREGGQVRAAEAGRRGSVGHVEVFRMDGVGTSIVGRPRRLSADRRARPTYTLIWEEPGKPAHCEFAVGTGIRSWVGRAESQGISIPVRTSTFSCVRSSIAECTPSLPIPESLTPPYGI